MNQFIATLLGLLSTKIFPIAANPDPSKQKVEFLSSKSNLSQTPAITRIPPAMKPIFIPCLLSIQLQGNAKRGWAIVNNSPFKVTYNGVIWKIFYTVTLMLANVWTGMELTSVAVK